MELVYGGGPHRLISQYFIFIIEVSEDTGQYISINGFLYESHVRERLYEAGWFAFIRIVEHNYTDWI